VDPGQTKTVTYSVVVKADAARKPGQADNDLVNFLVPAGQPTPNECVGGSALCTVNPVLKLLVEKRSFPRTARP
jgi:hypothetical protein